MTKPEVGRRLDTLLAKGGPVDQARTAVKTAEREWNGACTSMPVRTARTPFI